MTDKVRTSRVKIYCPKCEEIYVPPNKTRLDGASFGTSIAQMFLQTYPTAIVLPPKVYFYEPVIHGFKLAGKRGSKYFAPTKEGVVKVKDQEIDLAKKLQPLPPIPGG
jgi:casein kinase II subunit beta